MLGEGTTPVLRPYWKVLCLCVALNSQGDAWLLLAPDNNCQPAFHIQNNVYNYSFMSSLWIHLDSDFISECDAVPQIINS